MGTILECEPVMKESDRCYSSSPLKGLPWSNGASGRWERFISTYNMKSRHQRTQDVEHFGCVSEQQAARDRWRSDENLLWWCHCRSMMCVIAGNCPIQQSIRIHPILISAKIIFIRHITIFYRRSLKLCSGIKNSAA